MAEEHTEAKTAIEEKSLDEMFDEGFDKSQETGSESSTEEKPAGGEAEGAEGDEDATSKKSEAEGAEEEPSGVEEKLAKIKEILGDDQEAIDAYVKEKGYHLDPAWQKLYTKSKSSLPDEMQVKLDQFNKVTSSPWFVKAEMEAQGIKPEVINAKMREMGVDVPAPTEKMLDTVLGRLNVNRDTLTEDGKQYIDTHITDTVNVTKIVLEEMLKDILPKQLEPLKQGLSKIEDMTAGKEMDEYMKSTIKGEGILDYTEDILPEMNAFLDKNKEATQADIFSHFQKLNHDLAIERLKTGKKREARTEKKAGLKGSKDEGTVKTGHYPAKTGDAMKDLDAALDADKVLT